MEAFRSAARELEDRLLAPVTHERELEEGRAYVAGLVRWHLNRALIASDPYLPRFATCMDTVSKWGLESPDNLYRSARIAPEEEYLITGRRGTCADLAVEVLTCLAGDDGTTGEGISVIDTDTLSVQEDGTYRIQVGGQRREENHLATGAEAQELFLRHSLADWDESVGSVGIERVGGSAGRAPDVEERFDRAAELLRLSAGFYESFADGWRGSLPLNSVLPPAGGKGGGFLPGQRNAPGQWKLAEDEALVVTVEPVDCRLMSVGIGHYTWFTSFDYRNHLCHRNEAQARRSSDGTYRYVISASDPGTANWIDTVGHDRGFMFLRWQGVAGDDPVLPGFEVVPVASVRDGLPAGEPVVDAGERIAEVAARRRAVDARFS